jgi:uncharacterized protein (TIGR02145 family)
MQDQIWTAENLKGIQLNDGHSGFVGTALKATIGWSGNRNGTDDYLFSSVPGGFRLENIGEFNTIGYSSCFWTSTISYDQKIYYRRIDYNTPGIRRGDSGSKSGFSVRCVKK